MDFDVDGGEGGVIGSPGELSGDDGVGAGFGFQGAGDGPDDFWGVCRDAAEDFAEVFRIFLIFALISGWRWDRSCFSPISLFRS